jgi:transposase, IS5 family
MSWKNLAQTSLSYGLVKHHEALVELDGIHQLIDWKPIEQQMLGIHAKKQGEAAWPPLLRFKALLLQSWYGLSDPRLEKQLPRDLMFRRFINLGLSATRHSRCISEIARMKHSGNRNYPTPYSAGPILASKFQTN